MDDLYAMDYYNFVVKDVLCSRRAWREDFASELRITISDFKDHLQREGISIARSCSWSSGDDCWIFSHLTAWNKILRAIHSELKEETPGQLALCPLQGMPPFKFSKEDEHMACIAVHWLLKEHHCICTVDLNGVELLDAHTFLFCNALSLSKAVKSLTLSLCNFQYEYSAELSDAVGHMTSLDKFKLVPDSRCTNRCQKGFEDMGVCIGSTNTITELSVLESLMSRNAVSFLNGCKICTNLKSLRVNLTKFSRALCLLDILSGNPHLEEVEFENILFPAVEVSKITKQLTATPLLKLQELTFHKCRFEPDSVISLGRALHGHEALTSLKIIDCGLNCTELDLLLRGLNCRKLSLLCLDGNGIRDQGATALAEYIQAGQEFGVVSLKDNMLYGSGVITLLEASLQVGSNTELHFGYVPANVDSAHKIIAILEREEIGERVMIVCNSTGIGHFGKVLQSNKFQLDTIDFDRNFTLMPEHLTELFNSLTCNRIVKHLRIDACIFDDASMEKLGSAFSTNRTLKSFESATMCLQPSHMVVFFNSLARNSSLSKLGLHRNIFSKVAVRAFVGMLRSNRTLTEFRHFFGQSPLLKILSRGLKDNYTLVELGIIQYSRRDIMFNIHEVLRRNRLLLNKATKFVLTKRLERSLAVAFEKVCMADSLVAHLKTVDGLSEEVGKARIRQAARFITDHYLLLSGVVKERLECFFSACGSVQIDHLSVECLEKIFSYLKLEDVQHSDG